MADDDIDDVVLNTLIAEGVDVPTAYVASIRDRQPGTVTRYKPIPKWLQWLVAIIAVAVGVGFGVLMRF